MPTDPVRELQERLEGFARARDWEQYHTPKNLAMALAAEAGELLELFQWLTPEQSEAVRDDAARAQALQDELADIAIYLFRFADIVDLDLIAAVKAKIERNESRYPAESVRGRADLGPAQ